MENSDALPEFARCSGAGGRSVGHGCGRAGVRRISPTSFATASAAMGWISILILCASATNCGSTMVAANAARSASTRSVGVSGGAKFVNKAVPLDRLRDETMALARKLETKSAAAVRHGKEAVRSVRGMTQEQALDFLNCKSDALKYIDPEKGRDKAMKMFLDEKSFKPGLGDFKHD
jgi:hypothetical protein